MGRNYFKRGISYFRRNGLAASFVKAYERLAEDAAERGYEPQHADEAEAASQRRHVFEHPYKFSILVPVYETAPSLLMQMMQSVGGQTYGNWELILADASKDASRQEIADEFVRMYSDRCTDVFGSAEDKVKYVKIGENLGIGANTKEALSCAMGDYIALLDHDDVLENTALFDIMSAIDAGERELAASGRDGGILAVYTDEDKMNSDGSRYFDCHKKPGPDPVLLTTNNYVCHFFAAKAGLVRKAGAFDSIYDGAQDHDLILRCFEQADREQIIHVPKVLYHWRSTAASTAENPEAKLYAYEAGKRAVDGHFKRLGLDVKIKDSAHLGFFIPDYPESGEKPAYITPDELKKLSESGGALPGSRYVMILSPDLEPADAACIDDMMSCMCLENVGAVTGKILTRTGRVESAGFDRDENGDLIPRFAGLWRYFSGYMHRADLDRLTDAFSPDCVLVRRDAVKTLSPQLTLVDGADIYYRAGAVFKRKSR